MPAPDRDLARHALVVVDVQRGFEDPSFGPRGNPDCEANVAALIAAWRAAGRPLVFVRHDWREPGAPLEPGTPGHELKDVVSGEPDLLVSKEVHSAFGGDPDLGAWLRERGLDGIVVCGITTDHCVSTTVRDGGDRGFDVLLPLDATHTFDRTAPDGATIPADDVARANAASLDGEFGTVVRTADLLG